MDKTEKEDTTGEDGEDDQKKNIKVKVEKREKPLHIQDDPGPSSANLPGSIQSPKVHRAGISKSDHHIRNLITNQDVANALKLTSMSFGTKNQNLKEINIQDIKIPMLEKCDNKEESVAKFMETCIKLEADKNLNVTSKSGIVTECATTTSCVAKNAQTEDMELIKKPNEVIVTKTVVNTTLLPPMPNIDPAEILIPKAGVDKEIKKKPTGSLSERSDILAVAQRDSLSSIGSNVCRICMTRGRERLISPCNCKGSLANVHLSCLERWLNQVGRNHCELCGFSYPAIRTPRYTVLQALRLWFGNPRNRSHLQSDCLIFWLLSTVTAGLLAVCIVGTQYFVIEGNKFGISHRITETAMDFFMAIVLCGYSVTVYLLWKDHYVMWNRWRRANVNVRLLLSPDANPVPFVPRNNRFNNIV